MPIIDETLMTLPPSDFSIYGTAYFTHQNGPFRLVFITLFQSSSVNSWFGLTLPTIAALTPTDIEVEIKDENISDIDFESDADLIGITTNTHLAFRAYRIAYSHGKNEVFQLRPPKRL